MCKGCKTSLCKSALGTLLCNMVRPISFATGGLIPVPCQNVNRDPSGGDSASGGSGGAGGAGGQGDSPPSAKQTAAAIQKDQKDAKARLAAVQYLATVDCTYYPEVQAALVGSLRTDTSECVRWAAAQALGRPSCCSKRSIEALRIAASGSDEDGNPAEPSCRVRAAASDSLQVCLACVPEADQQPDPALRKPEEPFDLPDVFPSEDPNPLEASPAANATGYCIPPSYKTAETIRPVAYYEMVAEKPMAQVVAEAQRAVDRADVPKPGTRPQAVTGRRNLVDLWRRARRAPPVARDGASGFVEITDEPLSHEPPARF